MTHICRGAFIKTGLVFGALSVGFVSSLTFCMIVTGVHVGLPSNLVGGFVLHEWSRVTILALTVLGSASLVVALAFGFVLARLHRSVLIGWLLSAELLLTLVVARVGGSHYNPLIERPSPIFPFQREEFMNWPLLAMGLYVSTLGFSFAVDGLAGRYHKRKTAITVSALAISLGAVMTGFGFTDYR